MLRIPGGLVGLALALTALGAAGDTPARGQAPDPPARPSPFRRPEIPRRPGAGVGVARPPQFRRPGTAPAKPPRYTMEVTGSKHVAGVYRAELHTTTAPAEQWEVYFPVATEMPRQTAAKSAMEPEAQTIYEASRAHRPVLRAKIPVASAETPQSVTVEVRYEATLLARRLVPVSAGTSATPVPPLNFAERFTYLASTPTLDFRSAAFHAWLGRQKLLRGENEDDVDFARRVFSALLPLYAYRDGVDPAPVSSLCEAGVLDCDTLSLVFTGALRAGGVPARVVYGWPTRPLRHTPQQRLSGHSQAEFFAEGTGWVPVDLAYGLTHRDDNPAAYFGNDGGDLLVVQVDPDYLVPHPNGTVERLASIHPGPTSWARGRARPDVSIRPLTWDVEVTPAR